MARRWRLLVLNLAAVGVATWWWLHPAAGLRLLAENYPLVRVGMTRAEVEGLLGGPPGDYGRNTGGPITSIPIVREVPSNPVELQMWCDDENRFDIYFDAQGRVTDIYTRSHRRSPPEGWFQKLRRRIEGPPPARPVYT